MKISLDIIPEEIILQYNIRSLTSKIWVYIDISKGMPSLKQAGRIANKGLQ